MFIILYQSCIIPLNAPIVTGVSQVRRIRTTSRVTRKALHPLGSLEKMHTFQHVVHNCGRKQPKSAIAFFQLFILGFRYSFLDYDYISEEKIFHGKNSYSLSFIIIKLSD